VEEVDIGIKVDDLGKGVKIEYARRGESELEDDSKGRPWSRFELQIVCATRDIQRQSRKKTGGK
jgi:hypothetical protein